LKFEFRPMKRHVDWKSFLSIFVLMSVARPAGAQSIVLYPNNLDFGSEFVGLASYTKTVALTNLGLGDLNVRSVIASPGFVIASNNCAGRITVHSACRVEVAFAPTSPGTVYGTLKITDDADDGPQCVTLAGAGITSPPAIFRVSTAPAHDTSESTAGKLGQIILMATNSAAFQSGSSVNLAFNLPLLEGIKVYCSGCQWDHSGDTISLHFAGPERIVPGYSIIVDPGPYNPNPFGIGTASATLSVSPADAATFSQGTVPVAVVSGYPMPNLSTTRLNLGSVLVGRSAAGTLSLSNVGTAPLTTGGFSTAVPNPSFFSESDNCGTSLAPGETCSIRVTFAPQWTGSFTAALLVGSYFVSLEGKAYGPDAELSATSLKFDRQKIEGESSALHVTLTNTGTTQMTIAGIATSMPAFKQSNNCPGSLAPGASCTIRVIFAPVSAGTFLGSLTITDNASGGAQTVGLLGAAFSPSKSVNLQLEHWRSPHGASPRHEMYRRV
jgi:HYDIN/CFA65/VesB-like, Ig-like domain/Cep192 domain 4